MAWQDVMTTVLRVMIQDMGTPPANADDSLQQTLVVAALLVEGELDFTQQFVADVVGVDIVPDPTDDQNGTRDDNFVNLVCMKAAAIIDQGRVRQQSGIVIRDNGSMVDLRGQLDAALKLLQIGWAKLYEDEKVRYAAGMFGGEAAGAAVLGPFRQIAGLCGELGYDPGDVSPREADVGYPYW